MPKLTQSECQVMYDELVLNVTKGLVTKEKAKRMLLSLCCKFCNNGWFLDFQTKTVIPFTKEHEKFIRKLDGQDEETQDE